MRTKSTTKSPKTIKHDRGYGKVVITVLHGGGDVEYRAELYNVRVGHTYASFEAAESAVQAAAIEAAKLAAKQQPPAMTTPVVWLDDLLGRGMPNGDLDKFKQTFGESMAITPENAIRAQEIRVPLAWIARYLFHRGNILLGFERAEQAAWAAFFATNPEVHEAHMQVTSEHLSNYSRGLISRSEYTTLQTAEIEQYSAAVADIAQIAWQVITDAFVEAYVIAYPRWAQQEAA